MVFKNNKFSVVFKVFQFAPAMKGDVRFMRVKPNTKFHYIVAWKVFGYKVFQLCGIQRQRHGRSIRQGHREVNLETGARSHYFLE